MSGKTNEELADWLEGYAGFQYAADDTKATLIEAAARLRQQSEDSARLDFVIERQAEISRAGKSWTFGWFDGLKRRRVDGGNAREAIDKARES